MGRLIAARERNDDLLRGLEDERQGLLARGGLIPSPVWRRCGPKPTVAVIPRPRP